MAVQTKAVTLIINFSLLEANVHLPTSVTHDTLATVVEVVS